jgi:hypothetical protein
MNFDQALQIALKEAQESESGWYPVEEPITWYLAPGAWEEPQTIDDAMIIQQIEDISGEQYTGNASFGLEGVVLQLTGGKVAKIWIGPKAAFRVWDAIYKLGNIEGVTKVHFAGDIDLGIEFEGKMKHPLTIVDQVTIADKPMDQDQYDEIKRKLERVGVSIPAETTIQTGYTADGKFVIYDFK